MAVDDHGIEVLKKAGEEVVSGDKSDYYLKTSVINTTAIPVTFTEGDAVAEYAEISSLASGALTTILTYTIPVAKTLKLERVEVSGCNVADYIVEIDGVVKGKRRTYFGGFNADFNLGGLPVATGLVVRVRVIHTRPSAGDFDATLIGALL